MAEITSRDLIFSNEIYRERMRAALLRNTSPEPNSGCWLWMGGVGPTGYGYMTGGKKHHHIAVHIASYELFKGRVPAGMEIDHKCRVRCCVNPDHLQTLTHADNVRRGIDVGGHVSRVQKAKTHCPYGHPYSGDNLAISKYGSRQCRECWRFWGKNKRPRKRGGY